jgi:uncharacterized protein
MRIVAVEEHFVAADLAARIDAAQKRHGNASASTERARGRKERELADLGTARIATMDEAGIALQVLSVPGGGADVLEGSVGIELARTYNERLAEAVAQHPGRFAALAHLPMRSPQAAADELERTVRQHGFLGALINGLTDGRCLDHPDFVPVLARAAELNVPIYIHPAPAVEPVRRAYYDGLPSALSHALATSAFGWHIEVAIQVLRLVLSGALDRHPGLNIIVGHMGETLPFMLARCEDKAGAAAAKVLQRSLTQTIMDQVWITTSGFFTVPPFLAALHTFGSDRILFAVDYPYSSNAEARAFLDRLPVSVSDREKIAHGNADRLLRLAAAR